MRLSLLRGPGWPDPEADQGRHRFAYATLAHIGDDLRSPDGVVAQAEWFNLPMTFEEAGDEGQVVTVDRPGSQRRGRQVGGVGSDAVVVRLCEVWGSRGARPR